MEPNYIPGRKPVLELLSTAADKIDLILVKKPTPRELNQVIEKCKESGVRYRFSSAQEMDRMVRGHQGVAARVRLSENTTAEELIELSKAKPFPVILALDQVQDSGNLGTLARTLSALGGMGLVMPKDRSAHPGPGAMKSSAGALARIPVAQVTNLARTLDMMRDKGMWIYGAHLDQEGPDCFEVQFNFPCVLVLGGENKGIRPNVLKRCHETVHIPMPGGFDSLNVAQAGAVILGQMLRSVSLERPGTEPASNLKQP